VASRTQFPKLLMHPGGSIRGTDDVHDSEPHLAR
jgi:hypothetical protein